MSTVTCGDLGSAWQIPTWCVKQAQETTWCSMRKRPLTVRVALFGRFECRFVGAVPKSMGYSFITIATIISSIQVAPKNALFRVLGATLRLIEAMVFETGTVFCAWWVLSLHRSFFERDFGSNHTNLLASMADLRTALRQLKRKLPISSHHPAGLSDDWNFTSGDSRCLL